MLSLILATLVAQTQWSTVVPDCHDGDTCKITVRYPTPFSMDIVVHESMRFCNINAPELSTGEPGKQARDYLLSRIRSAKVIEFRPWLRNATVQRDKYGRFLGWLILDGINVNDEMVQKGYAVAYAAECR